MTEIAPEALIALGANLPSDAGAPEDTLKAAIEALSDDVIEIRAVSRFFRTPCFPAGAGPDYVNAALALRTDLAPEELLDRLHDIEARFGRARETRWGMRTLDLDLLAVGAHVIPDARTQSRWRGLPPDLQRSTAPERLILPHPRLQDRAFVLRPLADIAAGWQHPLLGQSVARMRDALPVRDLSDVHPL
jgi:2-amino-4-hydroxy-6-hydroxymethyldihydropteridine diphosphokinase